MPRYRKAGLFVTVRKVHPIYEIDSYLDQVHVWLGKHLSCNAIRVLGSGALYSPGQVGGSSSVTASITVVDTILTVAQMPSHSHGGNTGIEGMGQIYYDLPVNNYGMFQLVENRKQSFESLSL